MCIEPGSAEGESAANASRAGRPHVWGDKMFYKAMTATVVCGLLAGCVTTPATQTSVRTGAAYQSAIDVGNVQVPLPDGKWLVAGSAVSLNNNRTPIEKLFLVNEDNGVMRGAVIIDTNRVPESYGWAYYKQCERKDVHFAKKLANYDGGEQDCYLVNHLSAYFTDQTLKDPRYAQTQDYLIKHGLKNPTHVVSADFRVADRMNFVSARYYFNPEADGLPPAPGDWSATEWHKDRIQAFPDRKAYVEKIVAWADAWHPKVVAGFRRALGDGKPVASAN